MGYVSMFDRQTQSTYFFIVLFFFCQKRAFMWARYWVQWRHQVQNHVSKCECLILISFQVIQTKHIWSAVRSFWKPTVKSSTGNKELYSYVLSWIVGMFTNDWYSFLSFHSFWTQLSSIGQFRTGENPLEQLCRFILAQFNFFFNPRHDSTIPAPYRIWQYYDPQIKHIEQNRNYAEKKTKKVAWFVSNCKDDNGRLEYARELQKYIQVFQRVD